MRFLKGIITGQVMKFETLQDRQSAFRRFGDKVHPEQAALIANQARKLSWGDICACGLAG
jgi:hypothetical protein